MHFNFDLYKKGDLSASIYMHDEDTTKLDLIVWIGAKDLILEISRIMANKSEVSLFNGCMCMLQVHQAVSLAGQHYSWFAANTAFTAISLTCYMFCYVFVV